MFGFDNALGLRVLLLPLRFARFVGIDLVFFQKFASHEIGIAAQQNVCAASRHVGGDRDRAFASGLSHNLGFAFVILGIEHIVRNTYALQTTRNQFGVFDRHGADQ